MGQAPGVDSLLKLAQTPMTFLSAITVIMVAMILASPKLGAVLLEWAKWFASQKQSAPTKTGVATSQTRNQGSKPRMIDTIMVAVDLGVAAVGLLVLRAHVGNKAPLETGTAAFLVFIGAMVVVSLLRPLR